MSILTPVKEDLFLSNGEDSDGANSFFQFLEETPSEFHTHSREEESGMLCASSTSEAAEELEAKEKLKSHAMMLFMKNISV